MKVSRIKIEGSVYPVFATQEAQVGQEELQKIALFIKTVEDAIDKYLPEGRHNLNITEERVSR